METGKLKVLTVCSLLLVSSLCNAKPVHHKHVIRHHRIKHHAVRKHSFVTHNTMTKDGIGYRDYGSYIHELESPGPVGHNPCIPPAHNVFFEYHPGDEVIMVSWDEVNRGGRRVGNYTWKTTMPVWTKFYAMYQKCIRNATIMGDGYFEDYPKKQ